MASKKFTLLAVLIVGAASVGFGQLGGGLDYLDSSKIKSKKLPQYNEWKSGSKLNSFPPMPRHMGQLGVYGGMFMMDGDCPPLPGYNFGISYRKALGYVVSARVSFAYGQAKGLDYRQNPNLNNHPTLQIYAPAQPGSTAVGPGWYVHNFKTTIYNPAIDLLFSFNNIMFHRKSSKVNVYGLLGYSPLAYKTEMDLLNGSRPYGYSTLTQNDPNFFYRPRKDIRADLEDFFDGDYESTAVVNDRSNNFDDGDPKKTQWRHTFNTGMGLEFRIAPRMSISTEFKYQWLRDDFVDGWIFNNNASMTADKDNALFTNISLNFNL